MRLNVTYEDGEPTIISANLEAVHGSVSYEMDGSTAVCVESKIFKSEDIEREWVEMAYAELERADQEVRELPFVQAVDTGEDND